VNSGIEGLPGRVWSRLEPEYVPDVVPEDELPRVQGDRVQLQQVMLNLIVNAIQSMNGVEDGNRELHISTVRIEPEGVRVAVQDTGEGLRSEKALLLMRASSRPMLTSSARSKVRIGAGIVISRGPAAR
jgi:C4-dicarboxylate-specific signal transduction histidine kinase